MADSISILELKSNLAERSENYIEMVDLAKQILNQSEIITPKIRNTLSVAYKNLTGQKRSAWRQISLEKEKFADKSDIEYNVVSEYLKNVEKDLVQLCVEVVDVVDTLVIPKLTGGTEDAEGLLLDNKIFFFKMKGDYQRYIAEVSTGIAFTESRNASLKSYEDAFSLAQTLPSVNSLRLGLSLNFSVFYYEIDKSPSKACVLAKQAFDDAIKDIDVLGEDHYKDSTLIMQLLRDNLSLWTHREEEQIGGKEELQE